MHFCPFSTHINHSTFAFDLYDHFSIRISFQFINYVWLLLLNGSLTPIRHRNSWLSRAGFRVTDLPFTALTRSTKLLLSRNMQPLLRHLVFLKGTVIFFIKQTEWRIQWGSVEFLSDIKSACMSVIPDCIGEHSEVLYVLRKPLWLHMLTLK